MPIDRSFTCPVLVGRASQLDALLRMAEHARAGEGQVALISGEAGVGKSRLVREIRERAGSAGMRVVQGQCFEQDRAFPYAPLVDLLRTRLAQTSPAALSREVGADASLLAKLVPELLADALSSPPPVLDPEQEKRLLFQALLRFLANLSVPPAAPSHGGHAGRLSLLIALEDVHWCDDTSLEFLLQLARWVVTRPILVLVTYRGEEVPQSLRHALATLARERLAVEIALSRLSAPETEAMLRAIPAVTPAARGELVHSIYALTDGNPFFVEELASAPSGQRIPRSVSDAVLGRIATLSDPARDMLAPAAVAGRRFDFNLLQALTHRSEDELLAAIKELAAAQLVVEESADRFAFRHALTREAIYQSLLGRERARWHRAILEALERMGLAAAGVRVGDLAYHAAESDAWAKALGWAQQAGEQARRLYAPHEAAEHYARAIDAAHQIEAEAGAPASDRRVAGLYRARGQCYEQLGEFQRADDDFRQALDRSRAAGDRGGEWQALMDLGALWAARDYAAAGDYFQQALEQARALGDAPTIAQTLNRIGNWRLNNERPTEAQRYHLEALAIFEAAGNRPGLAETLDLLGMTSYLGGNLAQGAAYHHRALDIYQSLGDRQGEVACLAPQAMQGATAQTDTMAAGAPDLRALVPLSERGLQLARAMNWRGGEVFCLFNFAFLLSALGDYEPALRMASDALAIAVEIEHRQWIAALHITSGAIYHDLLALTAARQHLETGLAIAHETRSLHWVHTATGFLASVLVAQAGSEVGGAAMLERAASLLDNLPDDGSEPLTLGMRLIGCARVEWLLARRKPAEALGQIDQLLAADPNVVPERRILRLAMLRGEALAMLDRHAEAEQELLAAQALAAAQGARGSLWRILAALGNVRRALGQTADAEQVYAGARAMIAELAAPLALESLREHFTTAALARMPAAHKPTALQGAKQAHGGLTAREREVARLIAQGKSNREIAEALVLGERTIETHVGHILGKLGFASRSQIAAWAAERSGSEPR